MTSAAYHDGTYRCFRTVNGLYRLFLGCSHATPREAIAHTSDAYTSPLRREAHADPVSPLSGSGPMGLSPEPRGSGLLGQAR